MRLHGLAGSARHCQAMGTNVTLHMARPRFHLAACMMLASAVDFVRHFLTLGKWVVGVRMGTP